MASISCKDAASELLRQCIAGDKWDAGLIRVLAADDCSDALFRILVEGLADRFEPRLCDAYADIFSLILEQCSPDLKARDLRSRYERIRQPRMCATVAENVVVLSRVTLGADIAVTSVILNGLKRRFPDAKIYFAGNGKAAELFADDSRVIHLNTEYARSGSIRDRLTSWKHFAASIPPGKTIVVDPDSRLTQLGLLPLGDESNYFFFESRAYGGDSDANLSQLAAQWTSATFEVDASQPHIFPRIEHSDVHLDVRRPCVTVSLGTGGNESKALPETLEADLIGLLRSRFADVVVDEGFGVAEASRVARVVSGTGAKTFRGSFAQFASVIAQSACYVGYDSAGQHAAAAFGTPLLTLFKGFVSDRMFARWQPSGPGRKQILKLTERQSLRAIEDEIKASLDVLNRTA